METPVYLSGFNSGTLRVFKCDSYVLAREVIVRQGLSGTWITQWSPTDESIFNGFLKQYSPGVQEVQLK